MAEHFKTETYDDGLFLVPDEPGDDTISMNVSDVVVPKYLMSDKTYDILKWIGLIVCYALAILIRKVGGAWHFDADIVDAIAITIEAVGLFIGTCIGVSQVSFMKSRR